LRVRSAASFLKHVPGGSSVPRDNVSRPLNTSDTVANICDGLLGSSVPVPAHLHELALPNSLRVILPSARPALQRLTGLSQAGPHRDRSSFRVLVNAAWVSKTASTGSSVSREAKVQTPW
jgi:hypothetical protein